MVFVLHRDVVKGDPDKVPNEVKVREQEVGKCASHSTNHHSEEERWRFTKHDFQILIQYLCWLVRLRDRLSLIWL